jgi:hypothetical protein
MRNEVRPHFPIHREDPRGAGTAANEVFAAVNEGLFLTCIARLQAEMARLLDEEASARDIALTGEAGGLIRQSGHDKVCRRNIRSRQ